MDQIATGKYITKKRKEQNLTQEQLAERLGVSNKTISKWETGKCMPDYSIVESLCKELNTTLAELINGEEDEKKYHHLTPIKSFSSVELKQNPPMADAYIAGSDQIWNTFSNNGKEPGYYLDFGNDQTKRFSYAASLATNSIKDECKDFIKEKLAKFSSISVREKTGASLLADLGISNVSVVLDPVFLLDKSEWKQLSLKGNLYGLSHESYVLVYDFLGNDDNMISFVKAYAKEKSLKIVSINDFSERGYADININNAGPLEFLSLIDNAACVVASSFHATAFSVILEKEFYTFNLKGHNNSSRMLDFLSTIGLQDRMNSEDIIDNPIDWKKISSNLLLKLKQSKEFLNQIR